MRLNEIAWANIAAAGVLIYALIAGWTVVIGCLIKIWPLGLAIAPLMILITIGSLSTLLRT